MGELEELVGLAENEAMEFLYGEGGTCTVSYVTKRATNVGRLEYDNEEGYFVAMIKGGVLVEKRSGVKFWVPISSVSKISVS